MRKIRAKKVQKERETKLPFAEQLLDEFQLSSQPPRETGGRRNQPKISSERRIYLPVITQPAGDRATIGTHSIRPKAHDFLQCQVTPGERKAKEKEGKTERSPAEGGSHTGRKITRQK